MDIDRNLWTGNILLREQSTGQHSVAVVDWTHAQIAPFTSDVIHVLFTCCGLDLAANMTEAMNDYYDYLKEQLKTSVSGMP